jgi:hypothetical protein
VSGVGPSHESSAQTVRACSLPVTPVRADRPCTSSSPRPCSPSGSTIMCGDVGPPRSATAIRTVDRSQVSSTANQPPPPARGVQDRVAAQFGGDADHVIARWAFGQARRQPPSHQGELALLAAEHLPPPARIRRKRRQDRGMPGHLIARLIRVADLSVASHGQASSMMQMAGRPLFGTDDSPDVRPDAGDLPRNWQAVRRPSSPGRPFCRALAQPVDQRMPISGTFTGRELREHRRRTVKFVNVRTRRDNGPLVGSGSPSRRHRRRALEAASPLRPDAQRAGMVADGCPAGTVTGRRFPAWLALG